MHILQCFKASDSDMQAGKLHWKKKGSKGKASVVLVSTLGHQNKAARGKGKPVDTDLDKVAKPVVAAHCLRVPGSS
jgi:hypothetical protein